MWLSELPGIQEVFDELLLILADFLNGAVLAFSQFASVLVFLLEQVEALVVGQHNATDPPDGTANYPGQASDNPEDPVMDHRSFEFHAKLAFHDQKMSIFEPARTCKYATEILSALTLKVLPPGLHGLVDYPGRVNDPPSALSRVRRLNQFP